MSGAGTNWDVHFASSDDLSDAITFRRGVDESGLPGRSNHTLSIFGVDGSVRFRDSRSLLVRRPDREGRFRNLDVTVWAAVEIAPTQFEVLRHEENGDDWITLIKLRPGQSFMVETSPITPHAPNPPRISHNMLRLWSQQAEIRRKPYLAIVVRNHRTYSPWVLALQKEVLGPVVASSAAGEADAEPLIDLFSEDDPATNDPAGDGPDNTALVKELPADEPPSENPPDEPSSEKSDKQATSDPFKGVWERALTLEKSGQEQEKAD